MATKPLLTNTSAFDATVGTTFTFGWKGAQAFYNELVIQDSETLAIVYKYKIETMALRHVMDVAAGTVGSFINGRQYQATITVYDKSNTAVGTSNPVTFWCYSSPAFEVTNTDILSGTVTMSSLYLTLDYQQTEGETLKEYTVSIYDSGRNLLSQSDIITLSSSDEDLIYKIDGLTDKSTYFVKADGITYHGILVTTGYHEFTVRYDKMGVGAVLTAKNIGDGTISITSNFRITNAVSYPDPAVYIDNSAVDLTADGSYVDFSGGVDIGQKYEVKARMCNLKDYASITLTAENDSVEVKYMPFYTDPLMTVKKYYFRLIAKGAVPYFAMTKLFDAPEENEYITLLIASQNGYYSISVVNE